MPGIVAGALVAHPPILAPEVGGDDSRRVAATRDAMERLDASLAAVEADLLILISPHSPSSMTQLPLRRSTPAVGDLGRFRAPQVRVQVDIDVRLTAALLAEAAGSGFALSWAEAGDLDHGVVVPLHFLPATLAGKRLICMGVSGWPLERFRQFGGWLHRQIGSRSAVLIASGDLSHRLTPEAPYGFRPEGRVFDRLVIDALREHQWERIDGLDPDLVETAGECGLRPLAVMLGAAAAAGLTSEVLSYEGPFGVGYPVVGFGTAVSHYDIQELGRRAIDAYLRKRIFIEPPTPIPYEFERPSAVFVTLRKRGELRGCVGSLAPTEPTAAHEIVRYAVASAVRDPRFPPVRLDELADLSFKVQLLDPPERITDTAALQPSVYGIVVRAYDRQALLLPEIEGIETAAQQIAAACAKAGIDPLAPIELERFRTRTFQ